MSTPRSPQPPATRSPLAPVRHASADLAVGLAWLVFTSLAWLPPLL